MPDTEGLADCAVDALHAGTGRELAGLLAALPGMFSAMSAGLGELSEWAKELKGVSGNPGDLIAAMIPHAQQAAVAAEEASAAYRAENAHWLEGEDCANPKAEGLAEDMAEGFVPDEGGVPGFGLRDAFMFLPQVAELIATQLQHTAVWAEQEQVSSRSVADKIGGISGSMVAMGQVAEEGYGVYRSANSFWLDTRNAKDYR